MNELLTRELTTDELSLISGGGESDQNGFGLRYILDYWADQLDRFERLDRNGDGDGWDEIAYTYEAFTVATIAVTGSLAIAGNLISALTGVAAAALGVIALGARGIDTYGMRPDQR